MTNGKKRLSFSPTSHSFMYNSTLAVIIKGKGRRKKEENI